LRQHSACVLDIGYLGSNIVGGGGAAWTETKNWLKCLEIFFDKGDFMYHRHL
jgi:hypothetical protein